MKVQTQSYYAGLRILSFLLSSTVIAGCSTGPEPRTSENSGTYAALAVVPAKGRAFHGYAKRDTGSAARSAATSKCSHYACKVVQEYLPGQCVHIVLGDDQIYWNQEDFTPERRQDILDFCDRIDENCQVVVSECLQ